MASANGLVHEGHIVNIRTISRRWIEFVIQWPNHTSFTILLVQRCFMISDPLAGHPARALLQWVMEAYTQYNWETGMQENLSNFTPPTTISVHWQALSAITGYPATFTLAHTPVKLYVGQFVNILEYSGGGPAVGGAKIAAFHAIEQSWVDLLAQLGPDADRRHAM
ncbi:hypothetical protein EIP86_008274 [Pleurotus ostreatoroseus]|nr:hypothetical protein EIP86_008274 [Pleurotus ostreatoroseus]